MAGFLLSSCMTKDDRIPKRTSFSNSLKETPVPARKPFRVQSRDLAALDFLLGIPLAAEEKIVQEGWALRRKKEEEHTLDVSDDDFASESFLTPDETTGKWWSKYVRTDAAVQRGKLESAELEKPSEMLPMEIEPSSTFPAYTPGRRLEGDKAVHISVPRDPPGARTKQKAIANTAAIRTWERQTAHGLADKTPLLDGRLFMSASLGYPVSVFSVIRYEPRREQAEFLRKKLESLGGGGSRFVMPQRDWRGISYRALLPRDTAKNSTFFNVFDLKNTDNMSQQEDEVSQDSDASSESDDADEYVPGVLDDPGMVLGKNRHVMMGDFVTGPLVSSTIQFIKPALLKEELNRQFRERFDGWEPPKAARKYIGAYVSVQEGRYILYDPTEEVMPSPQDQTPPTQKARPRQGSITSLESTSITSVQELSILRMPPSLTLSKIRSLKRQALAAVVNAQLELGTLALACVYFERLCLDCRVDKSNRRLTFAGCLLIAAKLNEPTIGLVRPTNNDSESNEPVSQVRPNEQSRHTFAALLEFFTGNWSLSVKNLLDAEFGIFAALGFSLHATPSQTAFHFNRFMKKLQKNPREYLGAEMWAQWQSALDQEEARRLQRERRKEAQRQLKEDKLLSLQYALEDEVLRRQQLSEGQLDGTVRTEGRSVVTENPATPKRKGGRGLFNRFGMRRSNTETNLVQSAVNASIAIPDMNHPRASGPSLLHSDASLEGGDLADNLKIG